MSTSNPIQAESPKTSVNADIKVDFDVESSLYTANVDKFYIASKFYDCVSNLVTFATFQTLSMAPTCCGISDLYLDDALITLNQFVFVAIFFSCLEILMTMWISYLYFYFYTTKSREISARLFMLNASSYLVNLFMLVILGVSVFNVKGYSISTLVLPLLTSAKELVLIAKRNCEDTGCFCFYKPRVDVHNLAVAQSPITILTFAFCVYGLSKLSSESFSKCYTSDSYSLGNGTEPSSNAWYNCDANECLLEPIFNVTPIYSDNSLGNVLEYCAISGASCCHWKY